MKTKQKHKIPKLTDREYDKYLEELSKGEKVEIPPSLEIKDENVKKWYCIAHFCEKFIKFFQNINN